MTKALLGGLLLLFTLSFDSAHSISFEVGRGAYFLPENMPRGLQQDVYSLRGYISAVMEKIRTYGTVEGSFPGSEEIPLPSVTSVPLSDLLYASYPTGGGDPAGAFIITIGDTTVARSGIHEFVMGSKFRFDPQLVGDQIANWQCYTDLENVQNLYPGHEEPTEGSTCALLQNLGEIFTGCLHYDGDDDLFNPSTVSAPNDGWIDVYDPA